MSTNSVPTNSIPKLDDEFWKKMWEVSKSAITSPDAVHLAMAGFDEKHRQHVLDEVLRSFEPLHREIFDRVRSELESKNVLFASQPTKFNLLYIDSTEKHSAEVKRKFLGPNATHRLANGRTYENYDVESDIAYCRRTFGEKRRELYGREIEFLQAFEKGDLEVAEVLIRAIIAVRKNDESAQKRAEACSWLSMLAIKKNSLALFVESLNLREPGSSMIIETLAMSLQVIIYGCIVRAFAVTPSPLGIMEMATIGQPAFSDKHVGPYVKSAILEIAELISVPIPTTESGFRNLVKEVLKRRASNYLKVDPALMGIEPVWH